MPPFGSSPPSPCSGTAQSARTDTVDSPAEAATAPLTETVRAALRSAGQPLSRTALRQRLRVNNARLGVALQSLQQRGLAGWHLPASAAPAVALLAIFRPLFRCSTVPHQGRARNGTNISHTPRRLSSNQPQLGGVQRNTSVIGQLCHAPTPTLNHNLQNGKISRRLQCIRARTLRRPPSIPLSLSSTLCDLSY